MDVTVYRNGKPVTTFYGVKSVHEIKAENIGEIETTVVLYDEHDEVLIKFYNGNVGVGFYNYAIEINKKE